LGDPAFEGFLMSVLPGDLFHSEPLDSLLHQLRLIKDQEELRRLRRAVEITSEAHREVWRMAEPGVTEYQVEAALEYVFHANGAERVGFTSIVGSGPNSVVLHYDKNRRTLEEGDLVVVDVGAEFGYYTADLTRTFPANGRFSPRQAALYDLVLGARAVALEAIRPGGTMDDVNQAAWGFFRDHSGDLCGPDSCAPYLLHGVSHWLGMDVHDVGGNGSPFRAGMVLTLEPGLYLAEESLGIRIEDDILVTETGYEVLSDDLPLTRADIEAIMRDPPAWIR
jgi:Xaa-Pro aminopeptidase